MPLPNLKTLFSGGIKEAVKVVADVVDKFTLTGEEKAAINQAAEDAFNAHAEKMAELTLKELEIEAKDRDSARTMNANIQDSENASWMARNTAYFLDISITLSFYSVILMITFKVIPEENKELFYMVVGILGAKFGDVVAFHRGSSKGNEDKQRFMLRRAA